MKKIAIDDIEEQPVISQPVRRRRRPIFARPAFWLFIIAVVLGILYFQKKQEVELLKNPEALQAAQAEKMQEVIAEVKKTVEVAADEEVQVLGVIQDVEAAKKDQLFYKDVELGDYVLVFTKSSRVLIWRPSIKKIINFSIFSIQGNTEPAKPATAKATSTATTTKPADKPTE